MKPINISQASISCLQLWWPLRHDNSMTESDSYTLNKVQDEMTWL